MEEMAFPDCVSGEAGWFLDLGTFGYATVHAPYDTRVLGPHHRLQAPGVRAYDYGKYDAYSPRSFNTREQLP